MDTKILSSRKYKKNPLNNAEFSLQSNHVALNEINLRFDHAENKVHFILNLRHSNFFDFLLKIFFSSLEFGPLIFCLFIIK